MKSERNLGQRADSLGNSAKPKELGQDEILQFVWGAGLTEGDGTGRYGFVEEYDNGDHLVRHKGSERLLTAEAWNEFSDKHEDWVAGEK